MNELKRVSELIIENYYKAYRENHPHKDTDDAREATLKWAIGIHKAIFGDEQLDEAIKEYEEFIHSLEYVYVTHDKPLVAQAPFADASTPFGVRTTSGYLSPALAFAQILRCRSPKFAPLTLRKLHISPEHYRKSHV